MSSGGDPRDRPLPRGVSFWEESYAGHEAGWFFGSEPSSLARRVLHFYRSMKIPTAGRLLDLGCGEGRDVLFFASLGFDVDGVEGSPTAVERARESVAGAGYRCPILLEDLASFAMDAEYDVVFANNSIQFVGPAALDVLGRIRQRTRPGGWNAIGMFTREMADWKRDADVYHLEPRELKFLYRDWNLLEYGESIIFSPRRGEHRSFAHLIARKPQSG
ncbi:MAG: methyltransferase domain-containing protein [Candidatus Eisenbacteria bacterium]|nr:methyltransferase domain-containing protein [Candidatus Eisenbacteria bacterium]